MTCERCEKPLDEHPSIDVSNTDRFYLCEERAQKWARVEPGTVIPAGQPYRVEWPESDMRASTEYKGSDHAFPASGRIGEKWFVDSSWRPPLNLPTTPSVILAEVDDRLTEDKVLLFGPHHQKGSTWWSMNGSISVIPDEINSFEILWTETP